MGKLELSNAAQFAPPLFGAEKRETAEKIRKSSKSLLIALLIS